MMFNLASFFSSFSFSSSSISSSISSSSYCFLGSENLCQLSACKDFLQFSLKIVAAVLCLKAYHLSWSLFFWWWYWGLNSGTHTCWAGILLLEPMVWDGNRDLFFLYGWPLVLKSFAEKNLLFPLDCFGGTRVCWCVCACTHVYVYVDMCIYIYIIYLVVLDFFFNSGPVFSREGLHHLNHGPGQTTNYILKVWSFPIHKCGILLHLLRFTNL
jgi:hypothetical protein